MLCPVGPERLQKSFGHSLSGMPVLFTMPPLDQLLVYRPTICLRENSRHENLRIFKYLVRQYMFLLKGFKMAIVYQSGKLVVGWESTLAHLSSMPETYL
jgi:hypothetical protein